MELQDGDTIYWRKDPQQPEADGFEIKRQGSDAVQCRIHLYLDAMPEKYKLNADLSQLLNVQMDTKTEVIMHVWQYIKLHRLQDATDPRTVNCN